MTGTAALLALPHLAYGDAVHSMLGETGLTPDVLEAGVRTEDPGRGPELFLTLSWLAGHPDVDPAGLDLIWSHLTGWAARIGLDAKPLPLGAFAAPPVLADAVLHLSVNGLEEPWEPADRLAEWEHARALDLTLNAAAEQGLIAW
ncbi:hypothetical protein [Streptomyces adelaidensis]|uniref:hypothetical protein n=1 Tax=Streptomyces adelaidensis TaxID=2796465 RepID=UPI001906EA76|nr:hypothetical protein [Streptomyces adelaidensis]